jgi:WD40 repeat protein
LILKGDPYLLGLAAVGLRADTSPCFDAFDPKRIAVLAQHAPGNVFAVGAKYAALSDNGEVKILDPLSGDEKFAFPGHAGEIHDGEFDRSGLLLATSGSDGSVKIWDLLHGREIRTLRPHPGYA